MFVIIFVHTSDFLHEKKLQFFSFSKSSKSFF